MVTRREILTAGAIFGSLLPITTVAFFDDANSQATSSQHTISSAPISAFLMDDEVEESARFAKALRTKLQRIIVLPATLDSKFYSELNVLFSSRHLIGGITTGAALFCLERIAWNRGLRLVWRRNFSREATGQGTIPFAMLARSLSGDSRALTPSNPIRSYRPSRSEQLVHAWILSPKPVLADQA
jgi:hypothetical protein